MWQVREDSNPGPQAAWKVGVTNVIADAVVPDSANIARSAEAIYVLKEKLGIPGGCAPANALVPASRKG